MLYRRCFCFFAIALGLFVPLHLAHAFDVSVASVSTNGSWVGNTWTASAAGSTVAASEIQAKLATGDVTLTATGSDTLTVGASVTWSANTLILSAGGDIVIQAEQHGSGTAGLALAYGQNAVTSGNGSRYTSNAPVHLASTGSFSTRLGADGATTNYTVLTSLGAAGSTTGTDLQGINGNLSGNYVLGANIDASATSGWNSGAGFDALGRVGSVQFSGTLDGLGHAIDGLFMDATQFDWYPNSATTGLFRGIDSTGAVRHLRITQATVTVSSGGILTDRNVGTIEHVFVSGSLSGAAAVGGLVGRNYGRIDHCGTDVAVRGANGQAAGLAAWNMAPDGVITHSYAVGSAAHRPPVAMNTTYNNAGLVSYNSGQISTSYVNGKVAGGEGTSGFVARNAVGGTISHSYSTAELDYGTDGFMQVIAGFTAYNDGAISHVYYRGILPYNDCFQLTCGSGIVMPVGWTYGHEGPFPGLNTGTWSSYRGALLIARSTSDPIPDIDNDAGVYTLMSNDNGVERAVITLYPAGREEARTLWYAYQAESAFASAGFDISGSGGGSSVWRIYEGRTTPLLRELLTPLILSADNVSKTYDGAGHAGGLVNPSYSVAVAEASGHLVNLVSPYAAYVNVGSYDPDLWSDQQGYDISYVNARLTINAGALHTITVNVGAGGTASCSPLSAGAGTPITCTATPSGGNLFVGWTGGCAASFVLAGDLNCTASFAHDPLADPDTSINSHTPATSPTNSSTASFVFSGVDDVAVLGYECALDDGAYQACASPQGYASLGDGTHTFRVRAVDGDGNTDPTPASYTWMVDTTAPVLSAVGVSATTQTGTTLTATSNEAATGHWVVVARGANAPSAAQVKAGVGYGGVSIVAHDQGAMVAALSKAFVVVGLTLATDYDLYVVAEDGATNLSAPLLVQFSTLPTSYSVTVGSTAGGTASCSPSTAVPGTTVTCTATPEAGYRFVGWSGGCSASFVLNAHLTCTAGFALNTQFSEAAPGSGTLLTTQLAGAPTCGYVTLGYQNASGVGGTPPAGYAFPHGVVSFTTNANCASGLTVTLTYAAALPAGAKFFKYGPATTGASPSWYEHPATIVGNTITYSVSDNGQGDSDSGSGVIRDPGGVAVPMANTVGIPTLNQWALMLLTACLVGMTWVMQQRQACRKHVAVWGLFMLLGGVSTGVQAFDVTVGTASTNGSWVGNTWPPSAADSTVASSEIQAKLATGDVTLTATGSDALTVGASVSWSANTLTLSAGGDIAIQAVQNGSGTAGMALE